MSSRVWSWQGRAIAAVVAGLALCAVLATVLLEVRAPSSWAHHEVVTHLYFVPVQLGFGLVGAAVVGRRPRHRVGWALAAVGVTMGVAGVAAPVVALGGPAAGTVDRVSTLLSATVVGQLSLALLLFPDGAPVGPRWRWVTGAVVVQMALAAVATITGPAPSWAQPLDSASSFVLALSLLVVAVVSLVVRWRRASGEERQQVKWLALAGILFGTEVLLGLLTVGVGDDEPDVPLDAYVGNAVFALTLLSIPVAMGLAITRYRLYDVDRVISRALTYGALAVGVVAVYAGALVVVIRPLVADSTAATVVGLGVAALAVAVMAPVHAALIERTERWVYGERADRYETMRALAADLAVASSPTAVLERLAEAAARAARAQGARVSLEVPGTTLAPGRWGRVPPPGPDADRRTAPGSVVPLVVDGERVGEIRLATPSGRADDVALLAEVVDLAAPALHHVVATARLEALGATLQDQNVELAESRALLARAAEAERAGVARVIETDLVPRVDLLGRGLAGPTSGRPTDRRACYVRLATESRALAVDIRRLAHDVLPPLLVDHGLVTALRALAREAALDVSVEAGPEVERMPPEVETSVFLACREALAALGDRAALRVDRRDGWLHFSLAGGPGPAPGPGLSAAVGRVSALGGRVRLRDEGDQRILTGAVPLS